MAGNQSTPVRLFANPRAAGAVTYPDDLRDVISREECAAALAEISSWPGYSPTPLRELPGLTRVLGLARIWYKDESGRFGLKSFKALGGAYAVFRLLRQKIQRLTGAEVTSRDIAAGVHRDVVRQITVTCATDGNHGRSVAWGARLFGCSCVIYIHAGVSEGRRAAIARFGAEVVRVDGNYDDAVRHAATQAARNGWFVISDTSYEGYSDIPRDVMHGYTVMADEVIRQLPAGEAPTHVFVQAGVGGLAAALCGRFWQAWGANRPRFVVVEPDKADCHFQSAVHGRPTAVTGDLETVMAGLACGEVSLIAWRVLDCGADAFITIPDERALATVRLLANGEHGDTPLVAGETGVASLGGLIAAASDAAARAKLGLGSDARVLTFGSEGDTDPEIYRRIVGRSAEEVTAA